jgi:hypothetical protein
VLFNSFANNDLLDVIIHRAHVIQAVDNVGRVIYQPGKPENSREFEKSGKNREILGNFVNG